MQLLPISRRHLDKLSTELGVVQHATGSRPKLADGYRVDDVARALEVDLLHARVLGWDAVAESAWRNFRFLDAAYDGVAGRFHNARARDGKWAVGPAAEDSLGRVMLALGETIAGAADDALRATATELWSFLLPAAGKLTELRALASAVLGCDAILRNVADDAARTYMAKHGRGIERRFRANASSDWFWPEHELTHENAVLGRCLIVAGRRLGSVDMVGTGVQAVDWLLRVQTSAGGHLSPIGTERWARHGPRSRFDQLPIEATSLLLAAEAALEATGESRFRAAMELAYGWFMGENDLGRSVADPVRGACSDGLTPSGPNVNQGAESTLMWLTAAEHIRAARAAAAAAAGATATEATVARAPIHAPAPLRTRTVRPMPVEIRLPN